MKDRKGIGGRPRERADVKKAPISIRTDPSLRAEVEQLQRRQGLSFTQTVERLIRLGLERDAA